MATPSSAARAAIRPARPHDAREVATLYEICLRTGAHGGDASALFTDPLLLGEVYLGAYVELAPEFAFVLTDDDDSPVGYVLGTADTQAFESLLEESWWPSLREQYPLGTFPEGSPDERLVKMIHSPGRTAAELIKDYPAHLHVDLLPEGQGGGNGRRLIETLLNALRDQGVPGIHLGVSTENKHAIGFYKHLGFTPLDDNGVHWGLKL